MKKSPAERFREKYHTSETGCWIWTGTKRGRGYGKFWDGRKAVYAHRFSWELHRGPIPEGKQLDHFLMNDPATRDQCSIACVNPAHLEVVSSAENLRRSVFHAENARRRKDDLPEGVTRNGERFRARIWNPETKRKIDLGTFATPQESHDAYRLARTWMLYAGVA